MQIKSLTLQNFRTFRKKQVFNIEKYSNGLHFVTGQNLINSHLGANDIGKSSLVEAMTACLFGKTSTNLKADNIINWNIEVKEFCEVSIIIEKYGINYCIQRTWKPNTLTLTNITTNEVEIVIQEKLEEFLGCNFESFLYSTHIAQFTSKFIDLRPAEKMEVFTDILQEELKRWDNLSELCKNKTEEITGDIIELNNSINFQKGKLETLENNNYDNEIEKWEKEKQDTLTEFNKQVNNINAQIIDINNTQLISPSTINLTIHDNQLKEYEKRLEQLELDCDKIESEKKLIKNDLQKADKEITILKTTLDITTKEYNKFNITLKDSRCPSCKQIVSKEHIETELAVLNIKLSKIKNEIINYQEIISKLNKKLDTIEHEFNSREDLYNNIINDKNLVEIEKNKDKDKIQAFQLQQNILKNRLDNINKEKINLINKKASYEKAINPFLPLKEDNIYAINKHSRLIVSCNEEIKEHEEILEPTKYWIKAFKEIKLSVLEEKLKELEIYINNTLNSFGIGDWKVILKTFNETKSGNIRNEFNILISSPLNDKPVPFECWGGGLGQRLRLATTLGLMSFIQNTKVDFGIEFFDEPTAWLSQEGIEDLLSILYNRANDGNKKIFIIDHKGLVNFGTFNSVTNIIKDKNGSIINIQ